MSKPGYKRRTTYRRQSRAKPIARRRARSIDSAVSSCSSVSMASDTSSVHSRERKSRSYARIKKGVKKSVPAAVVLWAFHKLPSANGLTARRIINFLKKNFRMNTDNPRRIGKAIGNMLRMAVNFGVLEKKGTRYFLTEYRRSRRRRD